MNDRFDEPFVFDIGDLEALATDLSPRFRAAEPFPHVVIDDFLPKAVAERVLEAFPPPSSEIWLDWRKRNTKNQPRKQGIGHARRLARCPAYVQHVLHCFNSFPFLNFLEKLTGIKKILPDPYFHGGGIHQILSGGRLDLHTDFNHLTELDLYRRLNALLFLNVDWQPSYGGELELWDKDLERCEVSVAPLFNRLVIFKTNKESFHGHPKPLNTPEGVTRKSLALYYYTSQPAPNELHDRTVGWVTRED